MFSPELEKLISIALVDGIISEKEKNILIKKAINEGLDSDEFEMMLDAYLFKFNEENQKSPPIPEDVDQNNRCPACNEFLPQFSLNCISCGMELNIQNQKFAINELIHILSNLNNENGKKNHALLSAFNNDGEESIELVSKKCELIKNYTIPNNKAEILSFLSIAIPFARKHEQVNFFYKFISNISSDQKIAEAWKTKCEQIIVQARFSMTYDKKTIDEINKYATELKIN
jgi:hypothetical protein